MEVFISAILSDLTSRSMSFLIDRCSRPTATAAATLEETLNTLQRLLLRVHVVVEEAEQRRVTNHAMLRQLNQMRTEMYRGYHTLDAFRCQDQGHAAASPFSAPSRFNPAKRLCFHSGVGNNWSQQESLHEALARLETTIRDASELVVLLSGCPRRCRQPYSMYLLLDNCMFGRQMEIERLMEFLLLEEVPIDGNLPPPAVLPVVGPGKVGKSTLIEHACKDERVRNHFSKIMCFIQSSTADERTVAALSDCDVIKHRGAGAAAGAGEERVLVIIELIGDIDEDSWRKLYSDCKIHTPTGSKIIVASRSTKIARLGRALKVEPFKPEMYWYFFKVRTFGSADAEEHPKLAAIAMDLAREMNGCFFGASVFSGMLRGNFDDGHCWSMALAAMKEFKRMNLFLYREECADRWQVEDPIFLRRANDGSSDKCFVILEDYQTGSIEDSARGEEDPKMSVRDLVFGDIHVIPRGRFRVLAWRSHIPPHYSYVMDVEVRRPRWMLPSKKRIQQPAT